jgi:hypothetical protein
MKILVKFPTRGRPEKFAKTLKTYQDLRATDLVHFLITIDADDQTMNNRRIIEGLRKWGNLTVQICHTRGKIRAINYGMDDYHLNYDIILLASDDMIPQVQGWDKVIIDDMTKYYPDGDGVLWYNDGFTGDKLNTLCILGTKYFRRFGYIYHPDYRALWCDNEFMDVANLLKKQTYQDRVIIRHEHPINSGGHQDGLNKRDNSLYYVDKSTYERRKAKGFGIVISADTDTSGAGAVPTPAPESDQQPAVKPKRKRKSAGLHPVGQ